MASPLAFQSTEEYLARLSDLDFWWPHVAEILKRHGLLDARCTPVAATGCTYPTVLYGEAVVKLFGFVPAWRASHAAEWAAHQLLATDPEILAPKLLAHGELFGAHFDAWPYLITARISGTPWRNADLSPKRRLAVAADLGRQVRRLQQLYPVGIVADTHWLELNVAAAAERSSLPAHLVAQVEAYVARLDPFERVFVHSDLAGNHVFVEDGCLVGIIDWGDAIATDRHYEIIQPFRDMFDCDRALLRAFLEACEWPVGADFPRQALGHALRRQAIGLEQHLSMDVFEPIAAAYPLNDIATLDELAELLFIC